MKKLLSTLLIIFLTLSVFSVFASSETEFVIPQIYEFAGAFSEEGLAKVKKPGGEIGVINTLGEEVFGFDGTQFAIRKNGLIMALGENDKAAFFDKNGNQLTDYIYETFKTTQPKTPHWVFYHYLTDSHDGDGKSDLIPICRDNKFGYINSSAKEVIPPTYEYVFGFVEGISKIGGGGKLSEYTTYTECKYGYINEEGEVLYPADSLWVASDFKNGYAAIADGKNKIINKKGEETSYDLTNYTFIETNGTFILAELNKIMPMLNYYAAFDMNGNYVADENSGYKELVGENIILDQRALMNKNGEIIYIAPDHALIHKTYSDDFMRVTVTLGENGINAFKNGLLNAMGEVVLPIEYDNLNEISRGIFHDKTSGKVFDKNGELIGEIDGEVNQWAPESHNLIAVTNSETKLAGYIKTPKIQTAADELYDLGLFKGVSQNDDGTVNFELSREGTRTEALVMLIRALGKDKDAQNYPKTHPFTDVAPWADGYVSYAFDNGITKGISENLFGSGNTNEEMYLTFMLRALGYSDTIDNSGNCDFTWEAPYPLATLLGIPNTYENDEFLRSNMAEVTYAALYSKCKNTDTYLIEKLINEGAILKGAAGALVDPKIPFRETSEMITNAIDKNVLGESEKNIYKNQVHQITSYGQDEEKIYITAIVNSCELEIGENKNSYSGNESLNVYKMEFLKQDKSCVLFEQTSLGDLSPAPTTDENGNLIRPQKANDLSNNLKYALDVKKNHDIISGNFKFTPWTYDEAMAKIVEGSGKSIAQTIETPDCTIVLSVTSGTPHGAYYYIKLVYKNGSALGEGKIITLPLPAQNAWGVTSAPDKMYLSEDSKTLYYSKSFTEKMVLYPGLDSERLIHEKGDYQYTVNLETGEYDLIIL